VIVIGLTGSIGMGKSTAAMTLRRLGVPLFDADSMVHRLLAPGGAAVEPVATAFPGVGAANGGIDRALLGQRVFTDPAALSRLERIIHPMVEGGERRFLGLCRGRRAPIVALDIPLLFESGSERRCDYVVVVSAPGLIQRQRVLGRPGVTEGRLAAILKNQMPDRQKRERADFVVPTGLSRNLSLRRLRAIVRSLREERSEIGPGTRLSLKRTPLRRRSRRT
jgi:dephospho-CoA kinase